MKTTTGFHQWTQDKPQTMTKPQFGDKMARRIVLGFLGGLSHGSLKVYEPCADYAPLAFGDNSSALNCDITVHNFAFYRMVMLNGSIGAGEAYMAGYWSSSDLTKVIQLISRNIDKLNKLDHSRNIFSLGYQRLIHRLAPNSLSGSKKNIHAHYDLSNELFAQFLDKRMMYSSAVFDDDHRGIESAAENKLRIIGEKLDLEPHHHVIEIGSGWGGMSVYLAKKYGCNVTTTTISQQQYRYTKALIEREGVGDLVTVLDQDYRLLEGRYDRLVSIEMIEAVGHQYFDVFFRKCDELLKPHGRMVIQGITIPEQRYGIAKRNVDFIQRYIFPGGCLPSVEIMLNTAGKHTDLQLRGIDEIGLDYAKTLELWRKRFMAAQGSVRELGFDDVFMRLWEFYLCYCEGGFLERAIGTVQMTMDKVCIEAEDTQKQ